MHGVLATNVYILIKVYFIQSLWMNMKSTYDRRALKSFQGIFLRNMSIFRKMEYHI